MGVENPAAAPARKSVGPDLVDQLRRAIAESGESSHALGLRAGVDPGIVKRFADGRRDLYLATAARLAAALGLRLGEAVGPRPRRGR